MKTHKTTITSANILEVEAGTTGFCGGDSGHGCRTMLRIADAAGTDIDVEWEPNKKELLIELGGDCELDTFVQALKFAVGVYEMQIKTKMGIDAD